QLSGGPGETRHRSAGSVRGVCHAVPNRIVSGAGEGRAMNPIGLRLDPLDPLLFRDGRPFDAATIAQSGLPTPQTLAGALRTALLHAWDDRFLAEIKQRKRELRSAPGWITTCRFRGPWPALFDGENTASAPVPLLPTPAVLVRDEGRRCWDRSHPLG